MTDYDSADNSAKCYSLAVHELRLQGLRDGKFTPNDVAEELVASGKVVTFRRIGPHVLYQGDCRDILPTLGKVDAVVTDPPYHGVKADQWDNQWKTDADFCAWVGDMAKDIRGALSDNGSLYWFASPQMAARVEVEIAKSFRVINHIVWDKSESRKGAAGSGVDVTALRSYWSANTERLIFAENYAGDEVAANAAGYDRACEAAKVSIFGQYLRKEFARADVTNKQIASLFPSKTGGLTGCVSNWLLGLNVPTEDQYNAMRDYLNRRSSDEFLKREYEDLKREYEDLRRPFFLNANEEWGDVWRFKIEREQVHPTQKPVQLIRHIIKSSTRASSVVLDPFLGSGTTIVACQRLGRIGIGIERDRKYFDIACRRIEAAMRQPDLFIETAPTPKQEVLAL